MSFAPVAQRRHLHRKDVEAVEQIGPKGPLRDRGVQVAVGGRDDAHVGPDRAIAPHPLELALLQHAQQRHLGLRRELPHLVQEQGPAGGQLEAALAACHGPGEGAPLVAEQLGRDQGGGGSRRS